MSSVLPSPPPLATPSVPGLVSIVSQTFAGQKSFQNGIGANTMADLSLVERLNFATTTNKSTSPVVDGASALGHLLDTVNALSTAGAQILSVRNFGTEALGLYPNASTGAHPLLKLPESSEIQIGTGKMHSTAGNWVMAGNLDLGTNSISAANITGTNTGDVTIGAFGGADAKGLAIAGQVLNLTIADATHPGGVSVASQTFAGAKTFANDLTLTTGIEHSGVADGASAIAHLLNSPAYVTAGAKLLSLQKNLVEQFYVTKDGEVISLYSGAGGAASGHANFSVPNNPATSSPALANFFAALELGGKSNPLSSPTSADIFIGAMYSRTAGPVVTLLNNYGQGGTELHIADFMWNGDAQLGGNLYLGTFGAAGRVISQVSNLYLMSPDTQINWKNGVNTNDIAQWYKDPGGTLMMSLTNAGNLAVVNGAKVTSTDGSALTIGGDGSYLQLSGGATTRFHSQLGYLVGGSTASAFQSQLAAAGLIATSGGAKVDLVQYQAVRNSISSENVGAGNVVTAIGTQTADASVNANTKLLSFRTGLFGIEVEKGFITNGAAGANGMGLTLGTVTATGLAAGSTTIVANEGVISALTTSLAWYTSNGGSFGSGGQATAALAAIYPTVPQLAFDTTLSRWVMHGVSIAHSPVVLETSPVTMGSGTAVAFPLSTASGAVAGDKIASFRNNTVEKVSIDQAGLIASGANVPLAFKSNLTLGSGTAFATTFDTGGGALLGDRIASWRYNGGSELVGISHLGHLLTANVTDPTSAWAVGGPTGIFMSGGSIFAENASNVTGTWSGADLSYTNLGKIIGHNWLESTASGASATAVYLTGATPGYIQTATATMRFLTGTTFGSGTALGYKFDTANGGTVTGDKIFSFNYNGTEFANFQVDPTYGEPIFKIPVPASTVPAMKLGTAYMSAYGGAIQFGSVPATGDLTVNAGIFAVGGGSNSLSTAGVSSAGTYTMDVAMGGGHVGYMSGISIHNDDARQTDSICVKVGTTDTAPIAAAELFRVGIGLGTGYRNSVVADPNEIPYWRVFGDGLVREAYGTHQGDAYPNLQLNYASRGATAFTGTITGGTSGATATLVSDSQAGGGTGSGFLLVNTVTGVFTPGETITGTTGSATFTYQTSLPVFNYKASQLSDDVLAFADATGSFHSMWTGNHNVLLMGLTSFDSANSNGPEPTLMFGGGPSPFRLYRPVSQDTGFLGYTGRGTTQFTGTITGQTTGTTAIVVVDSLAGGSSGNGVLILREVKGRFLSGETIQHSAVTATCGSLLGYRRGIELVCDIGNDFGGNEDSTEAILAGTTVTDATISTHGGAISLFNTATGINTASKTIKHQLWADGSATFGGGTVATSTNGAAGGHIEAISAGSSYTAGTGPHVIAVATLKHPIINGTNFAISVVFITPGGATGTWRIDLVDSTTAQTLCSMTGIAGNGAQDSITTTTGTMAHAASIGDQLQLKVDFTSVTTPNPITNIRVEW